LSHSGIITSSENMRMTKLLALCFLLFAHSCHKAPPPRDLLDELAKKGSATGLTIGRIEGSRVEAIIFGSKPEMRRFLLTEEQLHVLAVTNRAGQRQPSKEQVAAEKIGAAQNWSDVQVSPDGKWLTYRKDDKFVLANRDSRTTRTLFGADDALTPPYWSPDSNYLMYVEKAGAWELGECAKYISDGRDVIVYRVSDGTKGFIYEVCDGYPYTALDWLILPQVSGGGSQD